VTLVNLPLIDPHKTSRIRLAVPGHPAEGAVQINRLNFAPARRAKHFGRSLLLILPLPVGEARQSIRIMINSRWNSRAASTLRHRVLDTVAELWIFLEEVTLQ
jgi:hypothetical protein